MLLQVLRRDDAAVPPHIAEGTEGGKPRPPGGERGAASAEKGSVYSNSELKRIFHFFAFSFSIYFSLFFRMSECLGFDMQRFTRKIRRRYSRERAAQSLPM